jgi:hypothetical protein
LKGFYRLVEFTEGERHDFNIVVFERKARNDIYDGE